MRIATPAGNEWVRGVTGVVAAWFGALVMVLVLVVTVVPAWAGEGGPAAGHRPLAFDEADLPTRFESVGVGALPRGVVSALAQDRAGFLWLGSGDGLVRYDGHHFRPLLRRGAQGAALSLGFVRQLLGARDGRLWIATESDGLAVHDPQTEAVDLVPLACRGPAGVCTVQALAEAADGTLWVGTLGDGLWHLRPDGAVIEQVVAGGPAGCPADDRIATLMVDREGGLWVGTWQGLFRRRPGRLRCEPVPLAATAGEDDAPHVSALRQAADGSVWIGTQRGGLIRLAPDGRQLALSGAPKIQAGAPKVQAGAPKAGPPQAVAGPHPARPASPGSGTAPARGAVHALLETPDHELWVAHAKGVEIRAAADGRLLRSLHHDPHHLGGLADDEVRFLLLDQAGWIWLGGYGLGLQRHNPGNQAIRVRGPDRQVGAPFESANVRSLMALPDGRLWIGTHAAGVVVMDHQLHVQARRQPPGTAARGVPASVDALAAGPPGQVWMAVGDAVHRLREDGQALASLHHDGGHTHQLQVEADGRLWVATQDGLYRLDPGARDLAPVALADGGRLRGDVYALAAAADHTLWVGGEAGLFFLSPGGQGLQPVRSPPEAGLGKRTVIGLLVDQQQGLWVDTAMAGLHRMTAREGDLLSFDRISLRHGVAGRPFGVNLLEDGRGRIWTQNFVYDPGLDRLIQLTPAEGVDIGTPWFGAWARTPEGRFVFGGTRGLLVVAPELYDPVAFSPAVVVSELRINGRREPLQRAASGLVLAPGEPHFSVEFAALDFSDPARGRYAYRLRGVDADWVQTGAEFRVAAYGNLAPGDYELRVRATNRAGAWSERELVLPVRVLPAWWQTWWARGLLLLAGAGALHAYLRLRTRRLSARRLQLEAMVQARTAELQAVSAALQRKTEELEATALTDPLTGLRNRRYLAQHIGHDVAISLRRHLGHLEHGRPARADADLVFFLVDIDHFKQVNDQHGHAAGDAVLVQVCERLRQVFRDSDHLVRWGGEEFLIVAPGMPRAHAAELAERARQAVAALPMLVDGGHLLAVSCSVGYAVFPLVPEQPRLLDWARVVNLADAALYLAKAAGRNRWVGVVGRHPALGDAAAEAADLALPATDWLASGRLILCQGPGTQTPVAPFAGPGAAATDVGPSPDGPPRPRVP